MLKSIVLLRTITTKCTSSLTLAQCVPRQPPQFFERLLGSLKQKYPRSNLTSTVSFDGPRYWEKLIQHFWVDTPMLKALALEAQITTMGSRPKKLCQNFKRRIPLPWPLTVPSQPLNQRNSSFDIEKLWCSTKPAGNGPSRINFWWGTLSSSAFKSHSLKPKTEHLFGQMLDHLHHNW